MRNESSAKPKTNESPIDYFPSAYAVGIITDASIVRMVPAAKALTAARAQGLDVRAGVHVGEVERRGDDIAGLAVHIAARISALAEPGEVLVSRTLRDLVGGSGLGFALRDDYTLKGVPEAWELFALES